MQLKNWKRGSQKFWADAYLKSGRLQSILAIYFPLDAGINNNINNHIIIKYYIFNEYINWNSGNDSILFVFNYYY